VNLGIWLPGRLPHGRLAQYGSNAAQFLVRLVQAFLAPQLQLSHSGLLGPVPLTSSSERIKHSTLPRTFSRLFVALC